MKHGDQKQIANMANISTAHLSMIMTGRRRPSWKVAKKLSELTRTPVEIWMEGSPEEIREAIFEVV